MCLGGCGKEPALCLAQHIGGLKRSKLNLDRLNLTQTPRRCACARRQSLGFQQTSSGWNDESLVRCICFLHITGETGRWGRRDKRGRTGRWRRGCCYWYAPCGANTWLISCSHSNDCLLWLICASCWLPTEHAHRGTGQCKWATDLLKRDIWLWIKCV